MELNEKIYCNIKYLCKLNKENLGDIENSVGLSAGYFSRLSYSRSSLKLDAVYEIAKHFGMTIDELIHKDIEVEKLEKRIQELETRLQDMYEEKQRLKGV